MSMITLPVFSDAREEILKQCIGLKPRDYGPNKVLNLPIPYGIGNLVYKIPKNEPFQDIMWHGPFFFNKIRFEDFYYLLRAVLLEKSIVFISRNLNLLTAIINGFRILLKPFKW
jgi:hypothetical protein